MRDMGRTESVLYIRDMGRGTEGVLYIRDMGGTEVSFTSETWGGEQRVSFT